MLQICSYREPRRRNMHDPLSFHATSSRCKLQTLHPSFNSMRFQGFSSKSTQIHIRVYLGFNFNPQIRSRTGSSPARITSRLSSYNTNDKKKKKKNKYGGLLPSILRSLDSEDDVEKTLDLHHGKLSPKEQTVILKEQRNWERAVRVFDWMKSGPDYLPNVIHYNVVLRVLGLARRWDELRLCWIDMAKNGVVPTNNTYAMLVDVYGKAGFVKEALLWIKHMKLRGVFPDEVTMNTAVRVLKDGGEYDRADRFYKDWCVGRVELDDLELDSMADSSPEPVSLTRFLLTELFRTGRTKSPGTFDVERPVQKPRLTATYNTLIDLYGKAGRLKDAADVFQEMLKSGIAMDTITFNTMIFTCGSHGNLSEAESLLTEMEKRGVSPDTKTYNIFLSLYADSGNIDGALRCYRRIREVGLFPDEVTRRAILRILSERRMVQEVENVIEEIERSGLCIDGHSLPVIVKMYVDEGLTERAMSQFEKCQKNGGLSSKTYAAVIDTYAQKGLWAEAESVFFRKRDSAQRKDIVEYNVMIKAYGTGKLYDEAFSLFKGMKSQGIWPDECTYNSLIQMFSGGDLAVDAADLLAEMRESGFKPSLLTYSAVVACFARLTRLSDAVGVYREMVESGVKPNEIVFGSLINGFAEAGELEEALRYFGIMRESGLPTNEIVLTSLVKAYGKTGNVDGARRVYNVMKDSPGGADTVAANTMLGLYADTGMVSEARSVFDGLTERGRADGVSFAAMMSLYKNMGMVEAAAAVADEMRRGGFLTDAALFNKALACYATAGRLADCGETLREMTAVRRLVPTGATLKAAFTLLKKGGVPAEGVRQLEAACRRGERGAGRAAVAAAFAAAGLHASAAGFCTRLEAGSGVFEWNVAIYVLTAAGRFEDAFGVLMRMQEAGLAADVVTCVYLVGCYGKAGMAEGVKRIYSRLKYGEIEPNESLFGAVIEAYRNMNRPDLAELVSQEMNLAFENKEEEVEYEYEYDEDDEEEDESDETSVSFSHLSV